MLLISPPLAQVVPEDIVQGSNKLPVSQGVHGAGEVGVPNVAGEVVDHEAPEVASVALVAVVQNATASVGAPDAEVAAVDDAE